MLVLNPDERRTAADLIKLPVFDSLRNAHQEVTASASVVLPLEEDGMYDYENFVENVSIQKFVQAIEKEISLFHAS